MPRRYLGIEIGGSKLQLVLGDDSLAVTRRWRFAVDPQQGGEGIRSQIKTALADLSIEPSLAAIAVGFGGPVDWRTGRICCSHQIEGWSGFDLSLWLRELTRAPVFVDNDANIAALGEAQNGAGRGFNPVFYVTLGSGVGGGLVVDGRIYHGTAPGEAEVGHIRLDRQGTIVEERCSGWAVDRKIREAIGREPDGLLARLAGSKSGGEATYLAQAVQQSDPAAEMILRETAEDLAFALSHVSHLFHPEVIVLGGGLSLAGEPLRAMVAENLSRFVMEAFRPGPKVLLAALVEDAVPIGALALAVGGQTFGSS